ncbi:mannosyltransferase [Flavobacterium sp. CHNK8]|uniref:mannosyltransferase n=1 Tax=Flavobacterium sp. CHNK8 TaxID=2871165 RepID=UPI001C8E5973|nr:mannosyltransferase [Flavobacterium sp. CHNK8]QZK90115.1 mannosyltransferase [Flavobacterium sp. CHNK8]
MKALSNSCKLYTLLSAVCYTYIGYFMERKDFVVLLLLFGVLFFSFVKIIQEQKENTSYLLGLGLCLRIIFAFALPNLSQDFFRFIWDGRILLEGFNPYTNLPNDLIVNPNFNIAQAQELIKSMGSLSASHFSNYPSINQLFFVIAGIFGNQSIVVATAVLRCIIIAADFGTAIFGARLLQSMGFEKYKIYWYILNPLVLIELTGNLHFEGVMLFFFIWGIYLLHENKWKTAAVAIALSIATKLLPLILLPLFFQKLGWKKSFVFYALVIGINILLFLPFLSTAMVANYSNTIALWFVNFEFNASFYYIIREIGFYYKGYNIIHSTGKVIPILIVFFIIVQSFFGKNKTTPDLLKSILLVLSIYFFVSTTIHPWYVINLVLVSVFTKYKFPIVWSFTVVLSYFAYSGQIFKENLMLIAIEYLIVFWFMFRELNIRPLEVYKRLQSKFSNSFSIKA